MPTAIDWSKKLPPWNLIGPAFRAECESIVSGLPLAPPMRLPTASKPGTEEFEGGRDLRLRRKALRLTGTELGMAAGYTALSATVMVSRAEHGIVGEASRRRIEGTLTRLEAERREHA